MDISRISKFDGQNFHLWKFQLNCAVKTSDFYDVATGATPKPEQGKARKKWIRDNAAAMFIIMSSMEIFQISLVENCQLSEEIISKLDSTYMQASEINKMIAHKKFYSYKICSTDSISQHIAEVESLARWIKDADKAVSDAVVITKILSSLPMKFCNFRQAWMSMESMRQTLSNLTTRLLDEEASLSRKRRVSFSDIS